MHDKSILFSVVEKARKVYLYLFEWRNVTNLAVPDDLWERRRGNEMEEVSSDTPESVRDPYRFNICSLNLDSGKLPYPARKLILLTIREDFRYFLYFPSYCMQLAAL